MERSALLLELFKSTQSTYGRSLGCTLGAPPLSWDHTGRADNSIARTSREAAGEEALACERGTPVMEASGLWADGSAVREQWLQRHPEAGSASSSPDSTASCSSGAACPPVGAC